MCECTLERWSPISRHEDYYEVSTRGEIRSLDRTVMRSNGIPLRLRGQSLTPVVRPTGHLRLALQRAGVKLQRFVHQIVLETFGGPCPQGLECCHNDGNPAHNCLSNLRWDTRSANRFDMVQHGSHPNARKLTCKRDHPLVTPNLAEWALPNRSCLACARAHTTVRNAQRYEGLELDLRIEADIHYRRIMS